MSSDQRAANVVLPVLILCSALLIYTSESPSRVFLSGAYDWAHAFIDWTTLSVFTFSILLYAHICFSDCTRTLFRWMGWSVKSRPFKFVVFTQVVSVTLSHYTTALSTVFRREIELDRGRFGMIALYWIQMVSTGLAILTLIPSAVYVWIKLSGRDKQQVEESKLDF